MADVVEFPGSGSDENAVALKLAITLRANHGLSQEQFQEVHDLVLDVFRSAPRPRVLEITAWTEGSEEAVRKINDRSAALNEEWKDLYNHLVVRILEERLRGMGVLPGNRTNA